MSFVADAVTIADLATSSFAARHGAVAPVPVVILEMEEMAAEMILTEPTVAVVEEPGVGAWVEEEGSVLMAKVRVALLLM